MSADSESVATDTIAIRLARYDHSVKRCAYVGGGIGGLLVLVGLNGNSIVNAPLWLRASVITLVIFAAAALGRAYMGFASANYKLTAKQKRDGLPDDKNADSAIIYTDSSHTFYVASLLLLIVAAILVIVGAWWPEEVKPATAFFVSLN